MKGNYILAEKRTNVYAHDNRILAECINLISPPSPHVLFTDFYTALTQKNVNFKALKTKQISSTLDFNKLLKRNSLEKFIFLWGCTSIKIKMLNNVSSLILIVHQKTFSPPPTVKTNFE